MSAGSVAAAPVTVVVCSRDRPERLAGCLEAVTGCLRSGDALVVVDSASLDGRTLAAGQAAGAHVVRLEEPGLSRARNAGLAAARTEVVAFTDDDCRPRPGWIEAVVAAFGSDERVAFVTGRVLAEGSGAPASVLDDPTPRVLDATTPLEAMGHGANMSVRVAAVAEIGGYDALLGAGARFRAGEDTDVYRRLLSAGWVGRYEPSAVVGHEQWRSRREALRMSYGYGLGFGAVAAKARHADPRLGRALLRRGLGPAGLGKAWRDLRAHYEFGVLLCLCWSAGVARGNAAARRLRMHDQLLMSRPGGGGGG